MPIHPECPERGSHAESGGYLKPSRGDPRSPLRGEAMRGAKDPNNQLRSYFVVPASSRPSVGEFVGDSVGKSVGESVRFEREIGTSVG